MLWKFFAVLGFSIFLSACAGVSNQETFRGAPETLPYSEGVAVRGDAETSNALAPSNENVRAETPPKQELRDSVQIQETLPAAESKVLPKADSEVVRELPADSSTARAADTLSENFPADSAEKVEAEVRPDIYVEIPKLARQALTLADSFFAVGMSDSAARIVEQFFVLKPLWEDWILSAETLNEKIRNGQAQKSASLKRRIVDLRNAHARRADYAEVRALADSIIVASPGDSLKAFADSLAEISRVRTCTKVKNGRDSALSLAREQAKFDEAERLVTNLMRRYFDLSDSLGLPDALLKISSMRMEEASASADYWKTHDPKQELEKAKQLRAEKKWSNAKAALQKLKSSSLRGEALRELDGLYTDYCAEKRKRAAQLFKESKGNAAKRNDKLNKAIESLDACLEFAPDFKNRGTVQSNKELLQLELAK